MNRNIKIVGARENNLKNISLEIPRNKITCLVGVSGSGKSTLAYNIIYSEGQRQFLESVNTFAARLLKRTQRPDIDDILNLSPTISIDQKKLRGNPRSTVGTTTEIYTYLRLLFSRFGSVGNLSAGDFSFNSPKGACKKCKGIGLEFTVGPEQVVDFEKSLSDGAVKHNNYKPWARLYSVMESSGRLDMDKPVKNYTEDELYFLLYTPRVELSSSGQGFVQRFSHEGIIIRLAKRASDLRGTSERKEQTDKPLLTEQRCSECGGGRLKREVLESKINNLNIGDYSTMELGELALEIKKIDIPQSETLKNRIIEATEHLMAVKLEYLSLHRSLDTLSGGEAQRLKLARELGSNLIEMIYIFDEPTGGLHAHDSQNIVEIIKSLKEKGNTVIVIEHNDAVMKEADHIIEIGPKAGKNGGEVVYEGTIEGIIKDQTR
jgi:excinuclease UvrABC ATPase subunit